MKQLSQLLPENEESFGTAGKETEKSDQKRKRRCTR